jgi:protein-L-isoaspartate(D-aspartate) O-methyltransferase
MQPSGRALQSKAARPSVDEAVDEAAPPSVDEAEAEPWQRAREAMVREQLSGRDIADPRVLAAMQAVPRHEFVPLGAREQAYDDGPLPIGHGATISQPYIVALMIQLARLEPGERVLDVGTGSGYQAAVLAEMGAQVWGIEIVETLASQAAQRLQRLGYEATIRAGDGYKGWPEHAPFDAIIIAAAAPHVPEPLLHQLKVGGRLVAPIGKQAWAQTLTVITRTEKGFETERITPVAFVPMTGEVRDAQ